MAGYGDKPFGLRQVRLVSIPKTGSPVAVELPGALTLSFKERTQNGELRGDDKLVEVVAFAEAIEWELEKGGISLEAYALMTGRAVTTSGTTPNATTRLAAVGGDAFPYFRIYGKALSPNGDDIHCIIYKAKITDPMEGEFKNGEFFMNKCSGIGIDNGASGIYTFIQNETTAALPAT